MGMYSKNKNNKVFARLTDKQLDYIDEIARTANCNRSEAIRIIIDNFIARSKNNENQ